MLEKETNDTIRWSSIGEEKIVSDRNESDNR